MNDNFDKNLNQYPTTVLAYMGDAVYEVYIRKFVIETGRLHADKLHHAAVQYVRAQAQAKALKALWEELTEEERTLVKRARNKKISSKPQNADPVDYKWATACEALIGYLFLSGQNERMEEIIKRLINHIGGKDETETNAQ